MQEEDEVDIYLPPAVHAASLLHQRYQQPKGTRWLLAAYSSLTGEGWAGLAMWKFTHTKAALRIWRGYAFIRECHGDSPVR